MTTRYHTAPRSLLAGAVFFLIAASACSVLTKLDAPTEGGESADGGEGPVDAGLGGNPDGRPATADGCAGDACSGAEAAAPYYAAQYISQSFPLATTALKMVTGQVLPSYVELENVGETSWDLNTQLGTTVPRDRASVFADGTWISPDRAAAVSGLVPPGKIFKFTFDLRAPETPGTYDEHFGLVSGAIWFGDVGQGGPPDDDIEVLVVVEADGG